MQHKTFDFLLYLQQLYFVECGQKYCLSAFQILLSMLCIFVLFMEEQRDYECKLTLKRIKSQSIVGHK